MLKKFVFKKVELWVLLLMLVIGLPAVLLFGWTIQYQVSGGDHAGKLGEAMLALARFPDPVMQFLVSEDDDPIQPQRITFGDFSGLNRTEPDFQDDGVLLISSYSNKYEVSVAYLYDIQRQEILHRWIPPVEDIFNSTSYNEHHNTKRRYWTQHPLLLENGDIIFTSGEGPLVRIDACSRLIWAIDRHFHHSIELSHDRHLYVPSVIASPRDKHSWTTKGHLVAPIRDDAIAKVTLDGRILQEWSVKDILENHGYLGLLYGVGRFETDRIHLNDIQPILESDEYVRKGDLALSLRNLSTVLLYRPTTDEIIWLKTGPWTNQHDVDYQGNGVFTIFGNDRVRGRVKREALRGYSTIWKYDAKTDEASEYLAMKDVNIFTEEEGLHTVMPNGDVVVEEQHNHLIHRLSAAGLRWSYAHGIGENQIGALHWSRYLFPDQADFPWLENLQCGS